MKKLLSGLKKFFCIELLASLLVFSMILAITKIYNQPTTFIECMILWMVVRLK